MPDDKKEFTAAQRRHADDVRMTRQLSRATGVPVSQIRRVLRESRRAEAREAKKPLGTRPVSETNPGLGPSNTPNGFPARPLSPPLTPAGGGAPDAPADPPLAQETFIVDNNGTLEFWKFNAAYDSDV